MTAADKLRELLADRPGVPNMGELVRWWRTGGDLVRAFLEERDDLAARLAGAEAANAATSAKLVEHSELSGHMERVEECHDWLSGQIDEDGDPSGKMRDFLESLRVVVDQLDVQRRSRNWYEAAYTAGKQKLIEHAVDKALAAARAAARVYVDHVDNLGAFADDSDPRVMATAPLLGAAHADLWHALGFDLDEEAKRLRKDIDSRCAVCGWPMAESIDKGCVRGDCSQRPRPERLYAPERAAREAADLREQPDQPGEVKEDDVQW